MTRFELPAWHADVLVQLVTAKDANDVLFHYYGPNYVGLMEPGSFVRALVRAMTAADPGNLARLAVGFPGLAAAVQIAAGRNDGVRRLRVVAGLPAEDG